MERSTAPRPDHTTRIVKSSEPEKRTHVPLTTVLPPPPPVPAALRVPYARVTALKTALLRRLLPPLACLGRPPSGAALRSAVAPHKGQVQRLAWTPRGGGGAPPSAEGGCQTEGKTCMRAGAFWRAAWAGGAEHNIEKAPARTCGKGASLNFCARGSCCPHVGWRGRGGGSTRGRGTFFGRPSRPPLLHGPWRGLDPAGPASRGAALACGTPSPTTTRSGAGLGRRRHARAVASTSLSGELSTRSRSTPRDRLPGDQKPPARHGCCRLGSVAFAQVSPPPEICCPIADDGGHSRRYWPEGPAPNLPAGSPVSTGYPSSKQRRGDPGWLL